MARMSSSKRRAVIIRAGVWNTTPAAPRTIEVLRQFGFSTTVLCWDRTGDLPKREVIDGSMIIRFRGCYPPGSIRFVLLWPVWWMWVLWHLSRGNYTLVHTMNLDSVVPAVIGKPFLGYRVIYDIRDAWGLTLTYRRFPVPQVFTIMDRLFTPMTDGLLLSQGRIDVCAEFFGRRARQKVPVIQLLNVPQEDLGQQRRSPTGNPVRINYSGHISVKRAALVLADAIRGRKDVCMDVIGPVREIGVKQTLHSLPNVKMYGMVPHAEAMRLMDQTDLVSLLYDPCLKVILISSANKMFEAMMLGKPYIATAGSYPAQIAEAFGLGWALPYGDMDALRQLMDRLVANPGLLVEAGQRGRQAYEKHFRWAKQRGNLEQLYRHVLREGPPVEMGPMDGWSRFIGAHFTPHEASAQGMPQ